MKNKILLFTAFLSFSVLFISSCSVGALVNIKAPEITHPVSHTDNFYSKDGNLITPNQYEVIEPFSFSFTKWGVSSIIDIEREADISDELNDLIEENNGDAIVNLIISVSDAPVNGLTFFTKAVSFWSSLIFIPLTIAEPSGEHALIAASSVVVYIFTPAAADIKVEGKVIRIIKK